MKGEVKMKKLLLTIVAVVMCLTVMTTVLAAPQVSVLVNGQKLVSEVPAQIIDGNTMVPLRAIFEALGAKVDWDDATKTVYSEKGDTKVDLTIGVKNINVNGAGKALEVAPLIISGNTLVPVRAIAEAYGATVGWTDATKTVTIDLATDSGNASTDAFNPDSLKGHVFDFDDYSDKTFNPTGRYEKDGHLAWATEGTDPMMMNGYPKYPLDFDSEKYYGVAVRFKYFDLTVPEKATNCQVYFKTDSDPVDSEAKSLVVDLADCHVDSEGYTWAVFDFSDNFNWYGTIIGVRFDPVNKCGGKFEVDKLIVLKK